MAQQEFRREDHQVASLEAVSIWQTLRTFTRIGLAFTGFLLKITLGTCLSLMGMAHFFSIDERP